MPRLRCGSGLAALAGRWGSPLAGAGLGAGAAIALELGEHRGGSLDLVADGDLRTGARRKVDVHARAEADEAVALAAMQALALVHVAQDAARDEAGDLHARDLHPVVELDH